MTTWKERLATAGEDLLVKQGPVRVLVDLRLSQADEPSLEHLRSCGLSVEEVIGNKVIGTVDGDRLDDLRRIPEVAEVEVAAQLRPHG